MKAAELDVLEAIVYLKNSNPSAFEILEKYIEENRDYFNGMILSPTRREDELLHWMNVGATKELTGLLKLLQNANIFLRDLQK